MGSVGLCPSGAQGPLLSSQAVDRIRLLAVWGLRPLLSCWCLARDHSPVMEASALPCGQLTQGSCLCQGQQGTVSGALTPSGSFL